MRLLLITTLLVLAVNHANASDTTVQDTIQTTTSEADCTAKIDEINFDSDDIKQTYEEAYDQCQDQAY